MKYLSIKKLDPHFNGKNIVSTWGNPDTIAAKPDIDFAGLQFEQNGKSVFVHCSAKDLFKWGLIRLKRDIKYGTFRLYAKTYCFVRRLFSKRKSTRKGTSGGH